MSDTDHIIDGLTDRIETLLDELTPGWVLSGKRGYLAPKADGRKGSWQIELAGPDRGKWVRYSQASERPGRLYMGGGPLGLVAYVLSGEVTANPDRRACDWAREFCGIERSRVDRQRAGEDARAREMQRRQFEAQRALDRDRRGRVRSRHIWRAGVPIEPGDPAHRYLTSRAIPDDVFEGLPTLRLVPQLAYWGTSGDAPQKLHTGPAMVAAIQSPEATLCGVHVTWLSDDGRKLDIEVDGERLNARKIIGKFKGCHVRFSVAGSPLVVGEGIESTLSVMAATEHAGWAALSLNNLRSPVPTGDIILAFDNDERLPHVAKKAKDAAVAAHVLAGARVQIWVPPLGTDWNTVAQDRAAENDGKTRVMSGV